jgi:dihydrolipoamide dehydrogenase
MAQAYDLIVIGTGPGGYVCAIRAAQLGLRVAVVEKRATHGGTCLNVGCIPSKALLHASEAFEQAGHGSGMGIDATPRLDIERMLAFKDKAVKGNVDGVAYLLRKHNVVAYQGAATILAPGRVGVALAGSDKQRLEASSIVIATGSDVSRLADIDIDEEAIVSSEGALRLRKVPKRLLVIGAGVIGLELGSVWRRLGSEVLVVEFQERILPGIDGETARMMQRYLMKQGMSFKLATRVTGVTRSEQTNKVSIAPAAGGAQTAVDAEVVLVAVGRVPYTHGLGLEAAGVATDPAGRVLVDAHYRTSVAGIYAIGDVIAGPMLAHKAEDEGIAVAEILCGQAGHVNYEVIPNVVYTFPELASVGKSEEELAAAGIAYKAGRFPLTANARARTTNAVDGYVKMLADAATDRILGVHIIAAHASEMIAEAAAVMEFGGAAEDVARTCHAHPTLTEAVREAALAVDKRALHI